jgi:hypothetical protein
MKNFILIFVVALSYNSYSAETWPHVKGFNYKKHYRKAKIKRFVDRTFNLNCYRKNLNIN